jgi:hypothetical protein
MTSASKLNSRPAGIAKEKYLVRRGRIVFVPVRDRRRWATGFICRLVLEREKESGHEQLEYNLSEPLSANIC